MKDHEETDAIGLAEHNPSNSPSYPWYDSGWLSQYQEAKTIIRAVRPSATERFVDAFRILHTREDFKVKFLERPFDAATFDEIKKATASLQPTDLKLHEAQGFGRFIVQNHPYFSELQSCTVPWVSEMVGEPVEPGYNFLSLYTSKGVCAVHMDAPEAKWTLDFCIDQGAPWPIYFSEVQPWPDSAAGTWSGEDWENHIKNSQSLRFTSYTLEPGQALIFSGSSQWHYRNPMPQASGRQFCNLLFLHFVPKGTAELVEPRNWARLFEIPELSVVARSKSSRARLQLKQDAALTIPSF